MRIGRLLVSIAGALMVLGCAPAQAASGGHPLGLERSLAHPTNTDRPSMLWWWPGAAVVDRATAGQGFASQPAVPAGLVGPVTLTPYRTATVGT